MTFGKFPRRVMIQTQPRCNAACPFCPYSHQDQTKCHGAMEDRLYQRIIEQCVDHRDGVQGVMPYLMNEPLMDPILVARINYAKQCLPGACVHILSNGSLLTERRGDELIDSGLDWIGLSVHGFSTEAYRQAMGLDREVTYRRVERFIHRALRRRGPQFILITFIGGGPISEEERAAEIAHFRQLGIERINYFHRPTSRAGNVPGIVAPRHARVHGCRMIWSNQMMHVLADGRVILCCMDWSKKVVLGDLQQQSMEQIWNSAAYQEVRRVIQGRSTLPAGFPCSECEEADVSAVSTPEVMDLALDLALVLLPCAVQDSDAANTLGVLSALAADGWKGQMVDLSHQHYLQIPSNDSYLWRRAGHGIIAHGDSSQKLMQRYPEQVEQCVGECRDLAARHLIFFLCETNNALGQEVIKRLHEGDPHRSILVYGSEDGTPNQLAAANIPYHYYQHKDSLIHWVSRHLRDLDPLAGRGDHPVDFAIREGADRPRRGSSPGKIAIMRQVDALSTPIPEVQPVAKLGLVELLEALIIHLLEPLIQPLPPAGPEGMTGIPGSLSLKSLGSIKALQGKLGGNVSLDAHKLDGS